MLEHGLESPECPVVLVVGCAEARDALWERDFEGRLKVTDVGVRLVVRLLPESLAVLDEQAGVGGAQACLARLVRADGDSDGLCLYWPLVLFEAGADDAVYADGGEAEIALEGKEPGAPVALGGGEEELDHGWGSRPKEGPETCVTTRGAGGTAMERSWTTRRAKGGEERGGGWDVQKEDSCGCSFVWRKME